MGRGDAKSSSEVIKSTGDSTGDISIGFILGGARFNGLVVPTVGKVVGLETGGSVVGLLVGRGVGIDVGLVVGPGVIKDAGILVGANVGFLSGSFVVG